MTQLRLVYGLNLLGSVGSFGELEYGVFLTCCFVQFLPETKVVFVHLELWVDFIIGYTEKNEVVPVWLE
jgi:hypothetical protein